MRVLFTYFCLVLCALTQADVSAIYGRYSPMGSISNAQTPVSWKLTPTGGGHVSRVEMLINDRLVPAEFNTETSAVEYRPSAPLNSGLYAVECRATIDGEVIARQDWSFEVNADNGPARTRTSFAAGYAFDATNSIRADLGLPALVLDDRMTAAAVAHSRYQILNGLTCHTEDPDKPGYTGKAPWDRIQHFGFQGVCYEGACGNQTDPRKAVRLLFDAPYHRLAFLQPGAPQVGVGFESGALTIDYAVSTQEGVGLSPAPGQSGTPLTWDGNESPSPLRLHSASHSVGYPIVFAWFSPRLESIKISSMRLTDSRGREIPAFVNTPANDFELRFAGIVTPQTKLQAETTYSVEVHATTERGKRIDRTWSFTTGR